MICPKCGVEFPGATGDECPRCGHREPTSQPPEREGLPWENRKEVGYLSALWETVMLVLFSPTRAFRQMKLTGGYWEPLFFFFLISVVVSLAGTAMFSVFYTENESEWYWRSILMNTSGTIVAAIAATVTALVCAWLMRLSCWIVRCKERFQTLLRLYAYAHASTRIIQLPVSVVHLVLTFRLVPPALLSSWSGRYLLWSVPTVWCFVILVMGFSVVRKVPRLRAAVAVSPYLLVWIIHPFCYRFFSALLIPDWFRRL